jgi:hypothetical protein
MLAIDSPAAVDAMAATANLRRLCRVGCVYHDLHRAKRDIIRDARFGRWRRAGATIGARRKSDGFAGTGQPKLQPKEDKVMGVEWLRVMVSTEWQ